jgi:hypothetical protein
LVFTSGRNTSSPRKSAFICELGSFVFVMALPDGSWGTFAHGFWLWHQITTRFPNFWCIFLTLPDRHRMGPVAFELPLVSVVAA